MKDHQPYHNQTSLKGNMLGCLECALFMPQGAKRFTQQREEMIRSFALPFLVLPITATTFIAAHPDTLSAPTMQVLAFVYLLRTIVYLAGFTLFAHLITKALDKAEYFMPLVSAHNWLSLPAGLLTLPLTFAYIGGAYSWTEVYPLVVCATLYLYATLAYMSIKLLKIPAELGIFTAIAAMALNQSALGLVQTLAQTTLSLLS